MRRPVFLGFAAFVALLLAPGVMSSADGRAPVIKYVDDDFGAILATPKKQALYYWNVEKRAGGKIRCKGGCARAWPPLIVRRRSQVPTRIAGISGRFGVIRRPDGRLQVTHRGLPVYTYAHEQPEQVLCDNVNGWFVVRLR
jgi:predicted lipoprotein with Yx(FWY)xxD motif